MEMKELSFLTEQHTDENVNEKVKKLREGIKRLKFQLARLENSEGISSVPAIEITFKNSDLANKYRTSIEEFLNTLLTEEEKETVAFIILDEKIESAANFCIDTSSMNEDCNLTSSDLPHYRTVSDEILLPSDDKDENIDMEPEESTLSAQLAACFNCLGSHHMRDCTERIDRLRVIRNKKKFAQSFQAVNNMRYHEDGVRKTSCQAGQISTSLRQALGLRSHQLPSYVYHMRILGYPPGWLKEAEVVSSGLNLYDSEGNAVANKDTEAAPANGLPVQYDSNKFIEYPGFNSPVPEGLVDEWQMLCMPPIQPHQQLSEALKVFSRPSPVEPMKRRRKGNNSSSEPKKVKNGDGESNRNSGLETPVSSPAVTDDSMDVFPGGSESSCDRNCFATPNGVSQTKTPQSSGSLSSTPGAALVDRGNPCKKLPDLAKFSQGITEHLPFENLPGATGTFEKMRSVLGCIRQKLTYDEV